MRTACVAFLLSMIVAALCMPLIRGFAHGRGLLDHAIGSRKIHGKPIPRLGGIGIVLGFFAPVLGLFFYRSGLSDRFHEDGRRALAFLAGGLVIAGLGLLDDLRGTGAGKKFAVQVAVSALLYYFGFRIESLATPFGFTVSLGALGFPLTALWVVGVINAMNLIDGLDGLAGGVAIFALFTNFVIAFVRGDATMAFLNAALCGAVLGFLFYNFNPASIFMGDTGSMFLGFVLAAGSIHSSQKSSTAVALLVPIVALALPIVDTLLAIVRRALRGRPLFSADKEHIHHRLLALGLTQRQAVMTLYGACLVLGAAALVLSFANSLQTAAVLVLLSVVGFFGLRRLGVMQGSASLGTAEHRRRNREIRTAVRAIGDRLRHAVEVAQVWDAVRPFGDAVGAHEISLEVLAKSEPGEQASVRHGVLLAEVEGTEPFRVEFALAGEERLGKLELSWADGRSEIDRDHEIAVEVLCDHIASALERIEPPAAMAADGARVIQLPRAQGSRR